MIVKLLTENHLEFLSLKRMLQEAPPSLHLKKSQIVDNFIPRLIWFLKIGAKLVNGSDVMFGSVLWVKNRLKFKTCAILTLHYCFHKLVRS